MQHSPIIPAKVSFSAREYNFTINNKEQKAGTKSNCLWYYEFDSNINLDFQWVSWNQNQNTNTTKSWEYLLLKIKETLYSGFINKSRDKVDVYYCELKPLPPREEAKFSIIY